ALLRTNVSQENSSMKKFSLLLCLTAILLSGCAQFITAFNAERSRVALDREVADSRERCEALLADAALNPIRDKVALYSPEQQTFAMRTNTDYASAEEKPVISLWAQKRDQCEVMFRPVLAKAPVQIGAVIKAARQVSDSMIAELYLG